MPLTVEQFTQRLTSSGVMSEDDLRSWIATVPVEQRPQDGELLARELVKHKRLTKFQAEQIYAGKEKSLTLGNYVILDKLGQGGMGMVLKAMHKRMGRTVALKVMSPTAVKSAEAVKRFHREVQAAAKLTHSNIVTAYDADEAKGTHFLVMEYVEGADLSQRVKQNGPLAVEQAIECLLQAARGLAYAHTQGIIHRDIKPANLLLDKQGTVKILDMGLARLEDPAGGSHEATLTGTGTVMGTIDYMSPEQALDSKTANAQSDIYSLGCTLFYLLTGAAPYPADTVMKRLLAHRESPIPRIPNVPTSVESIFLRMVAKKPSERYSTMTEVVADLQRVASEGSTTAAMSQIGASQADTAAGESDLQNFLKQISGDAVTSRSPAAPHRSNQTAVVSDSSNAETIVTSVHGTEADAQLAPTVALSRTWSAKWQSWPLRISAAIGALVVIVVLGFWWPGQKPNDEPTTKTKRSKTTTTSKPGSETTTETTSTKSVPVRAWDTPEFAKWVKSVRSLPPEEQVKSVVERLKERNPGTPGFDGRERHEINAGRVVMFDIAADRIIDLSPIRAFADLERLTCRGQTSYSGQVTDLSPLTGMKLKTLNLSASKLKDISALRGLPLEDLNLWLTLVEDLTPLEETQLRKLDIASTKVGDLSPLKKLPLRELKFDFEADRDLEVITAMPKLVNINGKSRDDFLADVPAERQVAEVIEKLKKANPNFDGQNTHRVTAQKVRELRIHADHITDISPVTELKDLTHFACTGKAPRSGKLWDISPLKGMKLEFVDLLATQVADLSPLRDLPLFELRISITSVTDLSPLKGRGLSVLDALETGVSDVTPLFECKGLRSLTLTKTKVSAENIASLQKALPNCKIHWDAKHVASAGNPTSSQAAVSPISALEFDGVDDHVRVDDFQYDGRPPLTLEAWLTSTKPSDGQHHHPVFVGNEAGHFLEIKLFRG